MTQTPGTLLNNRYRIETILGQGGMGAVYRATDEHLNISVAVKENLFLSDEYARQFQREASILASLRHENLPRVGDYFTVPGQGQYLIMDYIPGEDLRQRIERVGILPEQEAALIGVAICDGLGYMRSRKPPIVHRDIKPGNIKITPEGEVVLVDFGLAKIMLDNQATTTGARAMTPGYSPPEQYGTARTDGRSDIYSLGATLYAALTGTIPEDGLARATNKVKLTSLRTLRPDISKKIAQVIEKALSIEPEDRYQTPEELKYALLEATSATQSVRERVRVAPPPAEINYEEVEYQGILSPIDSKQSQQYLFGYTNNNTRKQRSVRVLIIALFLVAIGSVYSLYYFRPELMSGVLTSLNLITEETQGSVLAQSDADNSDEGDISDTEGVPNGTETIQAEKSPQSQSTINPTQGSIEETSEITSIPPTPTSVPILSPRNLGGGSGKITFVSERTGTLQIWEMDVDGNNQQQFSNIEEGACQPDWAPDASKLALISPCETTSNNIHEESFLYILDENGENPEILSISQEGDFDPAWSPDGNRLAFTSLRSGVPHVFIYNFETDSLEELSDTRYADIQPAWNPSGKQLAVVRNVNFAHIWLISDKGQTQMMFSSQGNLLDYWPTWGPDGTFIVFGRSSIDPFIPRMVVLDYEDRGKAVEERIPPAGEGGDAPSSKPDVSPDGRWIVYESWPDGNNHDIYLISIQGKNRLRLTTDPSHESDPDWKPAPQP